MTAAAHTAPDLGPTTEALFARAFADSALVTAKAAAALIGLDVKTLREMTDDLLIRAVRTGKLRRYAEADLRRFLNEGTAPCRSTSRVKPASSNTTSVSRVVDFTARRASKAAARRKR